MGVTVDPGDDLRVGEQQLEDGVAETRGSGSPPVPTNGLSMVAEVWWLKTITTMPAERPISSCSQANWVWSIEPFA